MSKLLHIENVAGFVEVLGNPTDRDLAVSAQNPTTPSIMRKFSLLPALALGLAGLVSHAAAATTGFNQTAAGPWDYNTSGNWVGGTINGIWDSSLTLSAAQAVTFGVDTTLSTGLTFNQDGNFALTLRGVGGNRTLALGGNILVDTFTDCFKMEVIFVYNRNFLI